MFSGTLRIVVALVIVPTLLVAVRAQATRQDGFTPEKLQLKKGNVRTSEAFVDRVYQNDGKVVTLTADYKLKPGEKVRRHLGADFSTRYEGEKQSKPMEFAAGVYGTVLKAGDGKWGTITVRLEDGRIVQYLHTSSAFVKVGDTVTPDTIIGVSGSTGATAVHIHIQAKNKDGKPIHPDEAFRRGQRKPLTPIPYIRLTFVDFDPKTSSVGEPKIDGDIVRFGYDENAEKTLGDVLVSKKWVLSTIDDKPSEPIGSPLVFRKDKTFEGHTYSDAETGWRGSWILKGNELSMKGVYTLGGGTATMKTTFERSAAGKMERDRIILNWSFNDGSSVQRVYTPLAR
jgi:hypothetical protein